MNIKKYLDKCAVPKNQAIKTRQVWTEVAHLWIPYHYL